MYPIPSNNRTSLSGTFTPEPTDSTLPSNLTLRSLDTSPSAGAVSLDTLPNELLVQILRNLTIKDQFALCRVSNRLSALHKVVVQHYALSVGDVLKKLKRELTAANLTNPYLELRLQLLSRNWNTIVHTPQYNHRKLVAEIVETIEALIKFRQKQPTDLLQTLLQYLKDEANHPSERHLNNNSKNIELDLKDININEVHGDYTALMHAASSGHIETLRILIASKAKLDVCDRSKRDALMLAASNGYIDIVQLLIENGAVIGSTHDDPWTSFMLKSKHIYNKFKELFINSNSTFDLTDDEGGHALILAARHGHKKIVQLLLVHRVKIDLTTSNGQTALMIAAKYGQLEIVRLLIENGANIHLATPDRCQTALIASAGNQHKEIVRLLIQNDANKDSVDLVTRALTIAGYGTNREIIELLRNYKESISSS